MDKVDSKTINYYYRNIRGSITNSLTNAEKTFIVNLKIKSMIVKVTLIIMPIIKVHF